MIEYYPDPLSTFGDGCIMDLRAKTAISFANAMLNTSLPKDFVPQEIAAMALNTAEELFSQAKERGWIAELPENSELNAAIKRHLERNVKVQLYQQKIAQQEQQRSIRPVLNG